MNSKEKEDMRWPAQVLVLVVVLLFMFSRTCKAQVVFHHLDSNFSSVTKIEYKDDILQKNPVVKVISEDVLEAHIQDAFNIDEENHQ